MKTTLPQFKNKLTVMVLLDNKKHKEARMYILNGIKNFLSLINDNWTTILVIVGLALALWKKIESYSKLSTDKKIEIAKKQISENILKLITQAEKDYAEWEKAGSIKRSEVISEIYKEYPILAKVVNQEELVKWIDEQIDNALPTLREIIKQNESTTNVAK